MGSHLTTQVNAFSFLIASRKQQFLMRCIIFLWVALTFSKDQAQGHLAIYHGYQPTRILPNSQGHPITSLTQKLTTIHHCRIHQLETTRRYLEALTTRLNHELQELQARHHHAHEQLQGHWNQERCKCENANSFITPAPTPSQPTESEIDNQFIGNASWHLESTESKSADSELTGDGDPASDPSFLSSTMFVLFFRLHVLLGSCCSVSEDDGSNTPTPNTYEIASIMLSISIQVVTTFVFFIATIVYPMTRNSSSNTTINPSLGNASCNHLLVEARTETLYMADINEFFICKLCKGYYRDPYTAKECLHTFCHGCIRGFYLHTSSCTCPTCGVNLGAKPWTQFIPDPAIKELSEKYLPDYREAEETEEQEFYANFGIKRKQPDTLSENRPSALKFCRGLGPSSPRHMIQFELYPQRGPDVPLFLHLGELKAPCMNTQSFFKVKGLSD
ncbi:hypothetical protein KXD40_000997 [Peronospora effusa]|nr:hypothetical protein KXD40_000997 [Peronospora effusa]